VCTYHLTVILEKGKSQEYFDPSLTLPTPKRNHKNGKKMDSRGIEPRTTPRLFFDEKMMLREYYTTKPQAHIIKLCYFVWRLKSKHHI
jgi:hypothetical protein